MWRASFKNGKILNEYDQLNGYDIIRPFSDILKDLDNLECLAVIQGNRTYAVHMKDGLFAIAVDGIGQQYFYATSHEIASSDKLTNIRPIYFARETVHFTEGVKHLSTSSAATVEFIALGFQANLDGANIKRYLAIYPNDIYTIEGD